MAPPHPFPLGRRLGAAIASAARSSPDWQTIDREDALIGQSDPLPHGIIFRKLF